MHPWESAVERWLRLDQDEQSKKQIKEWSDANDLKALEASFYPPLVFGTAGLRASMGPGFARMNALTVIQATQGLAMYLLSCHGHASQVSIVIGHDHRHNSSRFADLASRVMLAKGIRVYRFGQIVPTPFVPFAVDHFKAKAGIMITASHNPGQDNGYKVYWENGCQILSPHDTNIAAAMEKYDEPWTWDAPQNGPLAWNELYTDPFEIIFPLYFKYISGLQRPQLLARPVPNTVPVVYTAMHGVGTIFIRECMKAAALPPLIETDLQCSPDPNFPTVAFPNPEEGQGALKLAMEKAESSNSKVILANDPDADRLALAERQPNGKWHIFTGNALGLLFAVYSLQRFPVTATRSRDKDLFLTTFVSSKALDVIAEKEGCQSARTATGFKHLGTRARQEEQNGMRVLLAYEEAIGYMAGDGARFVADKDGISAAAILVEMVHLLYASVNEPSTIEQSDIAAFGGLEQWKMASKESSPLKRRLEAAYRRYGYFAGFNGYLISPSPQITKEAFHYLRYQVELTDNQASDIPKKYFTMLAGHKIVHVRDDGPLMLTFTFENGLWLTLRASGTEPKLKFYSELSGAWEQRDQLEQVIKQIVSQALEEALQPDKRGLKRQSS